MSELKLQPQKNTRESQAEAWAPEPGTLSGDKTLSSQLLGGKLNTLATTELVFLNDAGYASYEEGSEDPTEKDLEALEGEEKLGRSEERRFRIV
jgi:hypothetical protein